VHKETFVGQKHLASSQFFVALSHTQKKMDRCQVPPGPSRTLALPQGALQRQTHGKALAPSAGSALEGLLAQPQQLGGRKGESLQV